MQLTMQSGSATVMSFEIKTLSNFVQLNGLIG